MFEYKCKVYYVVDGDTVDVDVDLGFKVYTKQRIRLSGIDTPERGQPGYAEAKLFLTETVLDKPITLKTTKASKWGYFLGEILLDGVDVNQLMIDQGFAKPYFGGTKEV